MSKQTTKSPPPLQISPSDWSHDPRPPKVSPRRWRHRGGPGHSGHGVTGPRRPGRGMIRAASRRASVPICLSGRSALHTCAVPLTGGKAGGESIVSATASVSCIADGSCRARWSQQAGAAKRAYYCCSSTNRIDHAHEQEGIEPTHQGQCGIRFSYNSEQHNRHVQSSRTTQQRLKKVKSSQGWP